MKYIESLENKEMEINILALFEVNSKTSVQETAAECGCSAKFVHNVFKKHKLKTCKIPPWDFYVLDNWRLN